MARVCDHFTSEKHLAHSQKNKANRAKLPQCSTQGSKSYAASRHEEEHDAKAESDSRWKLPNSASSSFVCSYPAPPQSASQAALRKFVDSHNEQMKDWHSQLADKNIELRLPAPLNPNDFMEDASDEGDAPEDDVEPRDEVEKLRHKLDEVQKALDKNPTSSLLREEEAAYIVAYTKSLLDEESFLGVEGDTNNLNYEGLFFKRLNSNHAEQMICDVTDSEIHTTMFSIGNDKAPRPDGFTSVFFKKSWDVVGDANVELLRISS
ncbi:hypothetical protein Tco_0859918 [Tanacetum coccineum]|uniref:Uncharacterized protein n=1 Tax=Tanacetum coccineum TaxID=301880 RepID=A0ABQ5BDD9_9ASTR